MALRKAGISEIFSGLGGLAVMAGLYFFTGSRIFIFIGIFAGVLPAIRGISKILQARVDHKDHEQLTERHTEGVERTVLLLAKEHKGRLTPALVAVNSNVTLDEAEKQLNELVDKGYAELDVTEDGRMEYLFREFLPRLE